ncbi:MAG TPA: hypothetical protein VFD71_06970 [Planctomycetota bacterium]|nr:hypothetical protein [Planctomycetota bacterium]
MDRKQSTTNGAHPEHEQLGRTDARTAASERQGSASEKQESTADLLRREIARLRTDLEILIRTKLDTVRARVLSVALGAALGLLFLSVVLSVTVRSSVALFEGVEALIARGVGSPPVASVIVGGGVLAILFTGSIVARILIRRAWLARTLARYNELRSKRSNPSGDASPHGQGSQRAA